MKAKIGFAIGALASLALVSPSFALEPGPTSTREIAPPANKPSAFAVPRHTTGDVVSVNKRAQLFTLKTTDGETMLLRAGADTAPQVRTLKKGERVKVSYKNSQGEKVATKITPA
jgi:cold shock CspA family protein